MQHRIFRMATHVVCCLAFLCLPYVFAPNGFPQLSTLLKNPHERTNLLSYGLMLVFFYLNYYFFIPKLFFTKRYLLFALSIGISFGLILLNLMWLDRQDILQHGFNSSPPPPPKHGPSLSVPPDGERQQGEPPPPRPVPADQNLTQKPPIGFELSHALFLFLVGVFVTLSLRISTRLSTIEQEKVNTELSFLKAQINPHFLFNTLNSIYSLAILKSDHTPEAITRLSALMRHAIQDVHMSTVLLAKEFDYIKNYVELQRLRLDDTVVIEFSTKGTPNGKVIAPLILISFIENAFKYGVNPQEKSTISIHLEVNDQQLNLLVFNKKVRVFQETEESHGIGLTNTKKRLDLLYPNRHRLRVTDNPADFLVELSLYL